MMSQRLPVLIAALLAAATAFFLWGALAERSGEEGESSEAVSGEAGEESENHASEDQEAEAGEEGEGHSEEGEFRPLGLNLESTPLLVGAALVSLVLAGLVVKRPRREVLLAAVVLGVGFTALEIVEVVHQVDIDNTGILVLALIAGILHAAVAVLAVLAVRSPVSSLSAPVG